MPASSSASTPTTTSLVSASFGDRRMSRPAIAGACARLWPPIATTYSHAFHTARAILAGEEPERADELLASMSDIAVTEVVLSPPLDSERFDDLMRHAFERDDDE